MKRRPANLYVGSASGLAMPSIGPVDPIVFKKAQDGLVRLAHDKAWGRLIQPILDAALKAGNDH